MNNQSGSGKVVGHTQQEKYIVYAAQLGVDGLTASKAFQGDKNARFVVKNAIRARKQDMIDNFLG